MRNIKKYVGVALCAAMAFNALPVSGSFLRPAVVKASDTYADIDNNDQLQVASVQGHDTVVLTSKDESEHALATILNGTFRYSWTREASTLDAGKAKTAYDESDNQVVTVTEGKVLIPGYTADKPNLALVKLEGTDDYKGALVKIEGLGNETEPASPVLGGDGNFPAPSDGTLEYKRLNKVDASDNKNVVDDEGYADYKAAITVSDLTEADGEGFSYVFRKKANGTKFASSAVKVEFTKVTKDDIKSLKFKFEPLTCKVKITKESLKNIFEGKKRGELTYTLFKNAEKGASVDFNINSIADVEFAIKGGFTKVVIGVKGDATDSNKGTVEFERVEGPEENTVLVKNENSIEGFGASGGDHIYKTSPMDDYTMVTDTTLTKLPDGDYLISKKPADGDLSEVSIDDLDTAVKMKVNSLPISRKITFNAKKKAKIDAATEDAKRRAEEAKTEEPKKDETKTEEPKKDETKTEEPKTEEPKTETPAEEAPVNKTVSSKKTSATVSAEDVALVTGKLTVKVKGATVALPKDLLSEGAVKVSLKAMAPKKDSKDAKSLAKNLKKNKLVDKKVYSLSVKTGKENVKGKFTVTLKTSLKKAPKNLYVMNIANGKLMKAKFKKGMVTFTAGMTGKFVVVSK